MSLTIYADRCGCPQDQCEKFVCPPSLCVSRLEGEVCVMRCEACGSATWHQDGECLRCRRKGTE